MSANAINKTISTDGTLAADSDANIATQKATKTYADTKLATASLGANVATFLATPSSANLEAAVTGETGSGALVFGTSPTIATPTLTLANTTPTADGSIGYAQTGDFLNIGNGAAAQQISMGAWTSFTTTWTNITVGDASINTGFYARIGKSILFRYTLKFGSTTSVGGSVNMTLPVTIASYSSTTIIGWTRFVSGGAGSFGQVNSGGGLAVYITGGVYLTTAALSSVAPGVWTTNDEININGFYEAA